MAKAPKMCFDKILPRDMAKPHRAPRALGSGPRRAVAPIGKKWANGTTLRIYFIDGNAADHALVRKYAPEWTQHANLNFEFTDDPSATIRISFDANDGAWSYVGTDNQNIPIPGATMNLGWVDKAVILHEFGHMVGFGHEHQNPDGGIEWNEAEVIRSLQGPPNYWGEDQIRHNVLRKYSNDQVHGTDFDEESIMLYAFPGNWTTNMPGGTQENGDLSGLDKSFVASSKMYPGRGAPTPTETVTKLPVFDTTHGSISSEGEEDLFSFEITQTKTYVIETSGGTDLYMSLFGPDNQSALIAQDDDNGDGRNPRIEAVLSPGTYYAQVRHFDALQLGDYTIQVAARG